MAPSVLQDIFVPPEQVIDTVDLYFLKSRQRRLSLRFLSWFVLGQTIQTDTHDSIEDARTALNLYNKYHEFEEQGLFDKKLDELYTEGRRYVCIFLSFTGWPSVSHWPQNFKPPSENEGTADRTTSPPFSLAYTSNLLNVVALSQMYGGSNMVNPFITQNPAFGSSPNGRR